MKSEELEKEIAPIIRSESTIRQQPAGPRHQKLLQYTSETPCYTNKTTSGSREVSGNLQIVTILLIFDLTNIVMVKSCSRLLV